MSAGWETIFPKGLMCVVSRHKQNSSLHQHIAASWKLLLSMFIIAALRLGKLRLTGADPGPRASVPRSRDQAHSSLSLCLSSLCLQCFACTIESQNLPGLRLNRQESVGLTQITVRTCFLSIIKRVNTSMTKDTESLYAYAYWRHCVQCLWVHSKYLNCGFSVTEIIRRKGYSCFEISCHCTL